MSEKVNWGIAALLAIGIIYTGVQLWPPLLTSLHILVSVLLVLVVLLQSGRAADLAGAFGGVGSQTAFGPRGTATFLSKATTFLAVIFMVTSLALAIFASQPGGSVVQESAPAATEETAAPGEDQAPAEQAPAQEPSGGESPADQPPTDQ